MTITLPDGMKDELEQRSKAAGFASVDDYVIDLIEGEGRWFSDPPTPQELGFANQEELEAKLIASLDSGPPVLVTPEFWENINKQVEERIAARSRKS